MNDALIALQREINDLRRQLENFRSGQFSTHEMTWLAAPLTSTSWDGDAYSTTAKTLIDLSAVFAVPAGVRSVAVKASLRDSASTTTYSWLILAPNNTAGEGIVFEAESAVNDRFRSGYAIIPCDANGDIYYQTTASGSGTLDIILQIWGYER